MSTPPWLDQLIETVGWLPLTLVLVILALVVLWRRALGRTRRGNMRRGARARRMETEAIALLERCGFVVNDEQVTLNWPMLIDGEEQLARLRLDLLVERNGRVYVAEVKSGDAVRPTAPATRRQLLEYHLVCNVDGVLLVDMEERQVLEIEFPMLGSR